MVDDKTDINPLLRPGVFEKFCEVAGVRYEWTPQQRAFLRIMQDGGFRVELVPTSRTSGLPMFAPHARSIPEPVAPGPYYEKKE